MGPKMKSGWVPISGGGIGKGKGPEKGDLIYLLRKKRQFKRTFLVHFFKLFLVPTKTFICKKSFLKVGDFSIPTMQWAILTWDDFTPLSMKRAILAFGRLFAGGVGVRNAQKL